MSKSNPSPNVIEDPVRFSQSLLWKIQQNYFQTMGIKAWDEQVPFYISSNMFIATRYAGLCIAGIKDFILKDPSLRAETFYILEIGSGTGKFSFYFLKAFERLLKVNQLEDIKYCYIISDMADKNLDFCENNVSFQPYIEQKKLDFAYFNIVEDRNLYLKRQQKDYTSLAPSTPLFVIANYVFDCVKMDLFQIDEKAIQEVKVGLNSRYKNFNIQESKHLEDLRLVYQTQNMDANQYYQDPELNRLLQYYQGLYTNQPFCFSIPLGAIQFIQNLEKMTHHSFVMLIGDRGISHEQDLSLIDISRMGSFNGCYSFLINFDALKRYLVNQNGGGMLSEGGTLFSVNLLYSGINDEALLNLYAYYDQFMESMGPKEFCELFSLYASHDYRFHYEALISFLKLSEYDPDVYGVIQNRLLELKPILTALMLRELDLAIQKTRENIYHCPIGQDINNLMGGFYTLREQYDLAIDLFKQSIEIFKDQSQAYRNLAVIYENQQDNKHALQYFKEAYQFDHRDHYAKDKMLALEGKPTYSWLMPILKMILVTLGMTVAFLMLMR